MVIKTREKLIDVARQLFAHKGIENTTMSDIANASDKGRRTIYTYFKSKKEIYNAVIERESEQLVARLRDVVKSDLTPVEKLNRFIDLRVDVIVEAIMQYYDGNVMLRSLFMRNVKKIEKIRYMALEKEREILDEIVREGLKSGVFDAERTRDLFPAVVMIFQGLELSYLRNNFTRLGLDKDLIKENIRHHILSAITK
ncbi:MAG: TetR/AcrR family transcriptional regulator [Bacteroides sp.]|nr:TetR/AcrR family transcriptional regulator [Lachnospiraceae bacterium]MCM1332257.1 TetR/AcrR family transcriptional regulator [Bacteroides sp.]MCM1390487.1 TetR/AcrR family transcriptional regulator [Bacteroides sp.]